MADVARALRLLPAAERLLGDLADGEDLEPVREAAQQGAQGIAPVLHLLVARLAVARGGLAMGMPRERVPQDHLARAAGMLQLAPDDGGAALAYGLRVAIDARELEAVARDEVRLAGELDLRAERDAGEAATAMARRFAQEQDARGALARLDVRLHVLAPLRGHGTAGSAVALVVVMPGVEDVARIGRPALEEAQEFARIGHAGILSENSMTQTARMPAAFFGHGNPMNALAHNRHTEAWREFGEAVPRPRAVLAISAHWYINGTVVTAMPKPRTIHDFFGFPKELFEFEYPASGAPDVAQEVAEIVKPVHVGLDQEAWGLDHGTWSVLAHVFPKADVPVVQLSIHGRQDAAYHLDLGARLEPLRQRGVLIVASGNVVHNLRRIDWERPDAAFDWAIRFDEAVRKAMTTDPARVVDLEA